METDEIEVWVACPGFSRYQVSSQGRFRSVVTQQIKKKQINKRDGYLIIQLAPDVREWVRYEKPRRQSGKLRYKFYRMKTVRTAPLIAAAFLGPRPKAMQVDHLAGKLDERASQLQYVDQPTNIQRSYERGDRPMRIQNNALTDSQHAAIKAMVRSGVSQVQTAKRFKINNSTVSKIMSGKIKQARLGDDGKRIAEGNCHE